MAWGTWRGWPLAGAGGAVAGVGITDDGGTFNADMSQWLYAPAWIDGNNAPIDTLVTLGTFNSNPASDTEVRIQSKEFRSDDATSHINAWTTAPVTWPDTEIRYRMVVRVDDGSAGGNLVHGLAVRGYADEDALAQIRTRTDITHTMPATTGAQNNTCLISPFSAWFTPSGTLSDRAPLYLDYTLVSATASGSPDFFFMIGLYLEFR